MGDIIGVARCNLFHYNGREKEMNSMKIRERTKRGILYILALLLLATGCSTSSRQKSPLADGSFLRVDYVDVGQADFIILECDGKVMTIDGGNLNDSGIVQSCLKNRGIETVDTVIITHPHEDHYGGVKTIFDYAEVKNVYCPSIDCDTSIFRSLLKAIEAEGLEVKTPVPGEMFTFGGATVQIFGPVKSVYEDINDLSMVVKVTYGESTFLFTGDAEQVAESDILRAGFDVSADVLKVGHHGSASSTSYVWLKAVAPKYAVISSDRVEKPEYNHPHEIVVSRLRDADVTVYRTDLQGTITCITDGSEYAFMVQKNPNADTLYDAGAGGNH